MATSAPSEEVQMRTDVQLLEQRPGFGLLLDTARQQSLCDASLRLFSPQSNQVGAGKHAAIALARVRKAMQKAAKDLGQDVQGMADACHGAWVLSAAVSISEGGSSSCAPVALVLPSAAEVGRRLIDEAAFLFSALCLEGPLVLRPALLPCIGLLLQGRGHLLSLHPSLLESLRMGLLSSSRALRARAVQTVVSILTGPPGEHGANAVARQVLSLQPELLSLLAAEVPPSVTTAALTALDVLVRSAVVVPAVVLPHVLAECLAGVACNEMAARHLLLRLAIKEPQAFSESLLGGLHQAAELLAGQGVGPAELLGDKPWPFHALLDALNAQFSEENRRACAIKLLAELGSLQGAEASSYCTSLPLLAMLLFRLLDGLARDGANCISGLGGLTTTACQQQPGSLEPPLGTCVASLVMAALSQPALHGEDTSISSPAALHLAAALEELDVDNGEEHFVTELLRPGRRAELLAISRQQLADLSAESVQHHSLPTVSAKCPQAKLGTDFCTDASDASTPAAATCLEEVPPSGVSEQLDHPWFAEYDASGDRWRCTLCAEAGGRNPYAKGVSILSGFVSVRMRMHAKSAVHKHAEEGNRKESVARPGNGVCQGRKEKALCIPSHGCETKSKAIVCVEVEHPGVLESLQESAVLPNTEERKADVVRPKAEKRKADVEERQETKSFLAQYTDDWERSLRTDIQHFSELNELSPDAWVLANFDKNGTKIDSPQMIPKDRELWPIRFVFARRRTELGLETIPTSSDSCEHIAKRRRSVGKDEEADEPWQQLKTLCTMSRMGGA